VFEFLSCCRLGHSSYDRAPPPHLQVNQWTSDPSLRVVEGWASFFYAWGTSHRHLKLTYGRSFVMLITGNEFVWHGRALYQLLTEMDHQEQFIGAAQIRVQPECLKICTRVLIKSVFMYYCWERESDVLLNKEACTLTVGDSCSSRLQCLRKFEVLTSLQKVQIFWGVNWVTVGKSTAVFKWINTN